jgi:type II secretory pathway component PulJ
MDAARRYKARVAEVTSGLDARAELNAQRVEELGKRVQALGRQLREASDRHLLARLCVELAWESALDALWVESWITMRPFPKPDPWAKAADLDTLLATVEQRAAELRSEVQGRRRRS